MCGCFVTIMARHGRFGPHRRWSEEGAQFVAASNHLAIALPALVMLPSRWLFSPLLRQPGVRPK